MKHRSEFPAIFVKTVFHREKYEIPFFHKKSQQSVYTTFAHNKKVAKQLEFWIETDVFYLVFFNKTILDIAHIVVEQSMEMKKIGKSKKTVRRMQFLERMDKTSKTDRLEGATKIKCWNHSGKRK